MYSNKTKPHYTLPQIATNPQITETKNPTPHHRSRWSVPFMAIMLGSQTSTHCWLVPSITQAAFGRGTTSANPTQIPPHTAVMKPTHSRQPSSLRTHLATHASETNQQPRNKPTTHTNEISEGREKPSASKKKKNLEEERTKENRRRKRVEDNNVAYSKPLDLLLPHVLHPFKNWREQDIFEWEVSRTLALIVALIWGRRCFVCLCW